jgi:hypothetical protein
MSEAVRSGDVYIGARDREGESRVMTRAIKSDALTTAFRSYAGPFAKSGSQS